MRNTDFYAAAVTVIPLLLIATMAARSFRPGELQRQPFGAVLIFGLPVIGEVAAFAYLFFAPVPAAAAAILAVVTWITLLSQLVPAVWWVMELIRRDSPPVTAAIGPDAADAESRSTLEAKYAKQMEEYNARVEEFQRRMEAAKPPGNTPPPGLIRKLMGECFWCASELSGATTMCPRCGRLQPE